MMILTIAPADTGLARLLRAGEALTSRTVCVNAALGVLAALSEDPAAFAELLAEGRETTAANGDPAVAELLREALEEVE